ncbi:7TM diverse intracellular signaling domain-containing protein [Comamonas sp. GB3 AK4-5]|uniref:sensor histidine kinase n=1 Tax=Comamonas sp. GB3 AK4-5 TaxID=3231487 RepID=UPI00351E2B20
MRRAYLFVLVLWLCMPWSVRAQHALLLTADTPHISGTGALSLFQDRTGQEEPDLVLADVPWRALPGELSAGYTTDSLWLSLRVRRDAAAPSAWVLTLSNALFDQVELFQRTPAGGWLRFQAGEDLPRTAWPLNTRHASFPLDLPAEQEVVLLLHIQSRNAISSTVGVWQRDAFDNDSRKDALFHGLYFGCYVLLIVLHIFFWRMTREAHSGWYLLYVALALTVQTLTAGIPQWIFQLPGALSDFLLAGSICMALIVGVKFAVLQLDMATVWPRFSRVLTGSVALLGLLCMGLVLTLGYAQGVVPAQLLSLLLIALMLGLSLYLLQQGHRPARFFLFAFGIYYAGIVVSFMRNLSVLPSNFWTINAASFGTLIHMLAMSMRLHARYDGLRKQAAQAQEQTMQAVRRLNEGLEEEVAVRTADLEHEIERRKLLENELRSSLDTERRAKEEQRSFVAMVSHEFRTPLAIINMTAQQIARNPQASRDEVLVRCQNLRNTTRRMSDMVDQYLAADRMDAATPSFSPRSCHLVELLDALAKEWPQGRVRLDCGILPERVYCDPELMKVALRNLLANADRHAPPESEVLLHAESASDSGIHIHVRHGGDAIPLEEVPRLFLKYFRGRLAQHRPGAGLGLYLVQQIAQSHGGKVWLEEAGGAGRITFSLWLPSNRSE